jgi:hypothetical protein
VFKLEYDALTSKTLAIVGCWKRKLLPVARYRLRNAARSVGSVDELFTFWRWTTDYDRLGGRWIHRRSRSARQGLEGNVGTIVAGNHTKKGDANVILGGQLKTVVSFSVGR